MGSRQVAIILATLVAATAAASAHHGSADYHVDREQGVRGVVAEWRWSSPHTWIVLTVTTDGRKETWQGEGPPLTWASGRGWSSATLRAGETVALVMYPSRHSPHAGLVKRIQRANGDVLHVSRPWLDRQ